MYLVVARIGRPHGVHGEATIEVRTDSPEDRFREGSVLITEPSTFGPVTVESIRDHNGTLLIKFKEISDRSAIEQMKNVILLADVDISEGNTENQFHFQQLLNCIAYLQGGEVLGPVIDVVHIPGQDLLVISYQGREVMIPFVKDIVPIVDISNHKLVIVDKEGLLDA